MIKKLLVGSALTLGLGYFLLGNGVFSYVGTGVNWLTDAAQGSVPVEMRIEHAEQLIEQIEPEIRGQVHRIAEAEKAVQELEDRIGTTERKTETDRSVLFRMEGDLRQGGPFVYAGHSYTQGEVQRDIERRLDSVQSQDEHLDQLKALLKARRDRLIAAADHLRAMERTRDEARLRLDQLKTEMEQVRLVRAETDFDYSDSTTISELNGVLGKLETYIQAEKSYADAKQDDTGLIPVESELTDNTDVLDRVAKYREGHREQVRPVVADSRN